MTVLYRLDANAADVAAQFGATAGADPWNGGHVAPGSFAPVLTAGRDAIAGPGRADQPLRMIPRLWGVPPPGPPVDVRQGVLSVRNTKSPFWIGNLRNSEFRCLVPASAFMEWGAKDPANGKRRQHWLAPSDQLLFAFAGVWKDSEVPSFALLACEPNAFLRERGIFAMPVILPAGDAWRIWLRGEWNRAEALVAPYASGMMREV
ncbi:MAG: SOS response-associated peptidase family protein [Novosphingobium sp.]